MEATERYELAREKVAKFINAKSNDEIVYVRNTTEALNLVAYAWGLNNINSTENIVVTELEHHSNLVPWQFVSQKTNCELRLIPTTPQGTLDLSKIDELITEATKNVSIVHVSNLTGTINPVDEILIFWRGELPRLKRMNISTDMKFKLFGSAIGTQLRNAATATTEDIEDEFYSMEKQAKSKKKGNNIWESKLQFKYSADWKHTDDKWDYKFSMKTVNSINISKN